MDKQVDMSAFIGKDFDFSFTNTTGKYCEWGRITAKLVGSKDSQMSFTAQAFEGEHKCEFIYCRPRLNKEQVLYDWLWVPDGLVWRCDGLQSDGETAALKVNSKELRAMESVNHRYLCLYAMCIGVEPSHELWGKERGLEVISV